MAIKRPTRLNALKVLACPVVRLGPNLRQLMVIVGVKVGEPLPRPIERW